MTRRMERAIFSSERKTRPKHVTGKKKKVFIFKFTVGGSVGNREEGKVGHSEEQN